MRAEIIQLRSKMVNACVWVTFIHLGHKTRCVPFPWIIIEYGHEYGHSQASEWDTHLRHPDIFLSTVKEKWSHFDLKIESLTELKFDPGLEIFDQGRKDFFFDWRFRPWIGVIGDYLSQIDSILRLNYSESRVEFQFRQWLNFLGQHDSIITLFSSVWISRHFMYRQIRCKDILHQFEFV